MKPKDKQNPSFLVKHGGVSVRVGQYQDPDSRFFFRRKEQGRWKTIVRTQRKDIEDEAKVTAKLIAEQKSALFGIKPHQIHEFLQWCAEQKKATALRIPLAEYIKTKKEGGISKRYERSLDYLDSFFEPLKEANIRTVSQSDIERLLPKISGDDAVSARRRNNIIEDIATFFRWCRKRQFLPEGTTAPERIDRATEPPPKREIFTLEEIGKIFEACDSEWIPWLAIGAFAGLRTEEIQRLDWKDIKLGRSVIDVTAENAKTRTRRLVPIQPNLAAWLAPYAQGKGEVAPSRIDNYIRSLVDDGIEWRTNGLRHSYGSYRLAVIQDAARLAEEMGNSISMIRKHYAEAVHPTEGEEWFAITPKMPANVILMNRKNKGGR